MEIPVGMEEAQAYQLLSKMIVGMRCPYGPGDASKCPQILSFGP